MVGLGVSTEAEKVGGVGHGQAPAGEASSPFHPRHVPGDGDATGS